MSTINLLPWREAHRNELLQQFSISFGFVFLIAASVWGAGHYYHAQLIENQILRIGMVDKRIAEVDKKIKQIKDLENEKERLLSRMRAIEELQGNRPLIVRFFDELVDSLPDGVTILEVVQKGTKITVNGLAQSNARVSSFMRNLDSSAWLTESSLKVIKESNVGDSTVVNSFTLTFKQIFPKDGEEEVEKS